MAGSEQTSTGSESSPAAAGPGGSAGARLLALVEAAIAVCPHCRNDWPAYREKRGDGPWWHQFRPTVHCEWIIRECPASAILELLRDHPKVTQLGLCGDGLELFVRDVAESIKRPEVEPKPLTELPPERITLHYRWIQSSDDPERIQTEMRRLGGDLGTLKVGLSILGDGAYAYECMESHASPMDNSVNATVTLRRR